MNENIEKTIKNLERNNIKALYAENRRQAAIIVEQMLFENAVITLGGSVTVVESGIYDILARPCYRLLDRNKKGADEAFRFNTFKETVGGDFYFCSSNAVTENGELVNVDGFSNRISAMVFGPKKVVMIVGKNKLVKDVNEAFLRIKRIAAPKNCVRLSKNTPCVKLGHCMSLLKSENPDMTDGCQSPDRICRNYSVIGPQGEKDRICVIIVDENLGY